MSVISYLLNEDGTIPSYVTDGGYFIKHIEGNSPRNKILIGVTDQDVDNESFTLESLIAYVESYNPYFQIPITNELMPASEVVTSWWERHAI
jgi:hypothetical protein